MSIHFTGTVQLSRTTLRCVSAKLTLVATSLHVDRLRKEVKIRPGYTPEEDVQRYRSAHASKAGPVKKGIPGLVTAIVAPPSSSASSPGVSSSKSKAQKKNEKRKEKRKEENGELNAADASDSDEEGRGAGSKEKEEEVPESWDDGDEDDAEAAAATDPAPIVEQVTIVDPVDEAKRMKGLQKKLRQVCIIIRPSSFPCHFLFSFSVCFDCIFASNDGG